MDSIYQNANGKSFERKFKCLRIITCGSVALTITTVLVFYDQFEKLEIFLRKNTLELNLFTGPSTNYSNSGNLKLQNSIANLTEYNFTEASANFSTNGSRGYRNFTEEPPKIILAWTKFFGEKFTEKFTNCKHRCMISNNRQDYNSSDAVLFHLRNLISNGQLQVEIPKYRNKEQIFIFYTLESPLNDPIGRIFTSEIRTNFFNWTMTFRMDSDIFHPYGGIHKSKKPPTPEQIITINSKIDQYSAMKSTSAIWFASNCHAANKREKLVSALSKFIQIDIIGQCNPDKNKTAGIACVRSDRKCEMKLLNEKYWFYLALENSNCRDYISEKYFSRWYHHSVPIVMRRAIYEPYTPPHSFIAVDDFSSVNELASHLRYLTKNKTAYMDYLNWRTLGYEAGYGAVKHRYFSWCGLCEKLWDTAERNKIVQKSYDVDKWWLQKGGCDTNFVTKFLMG